jgi:hypothetical protein
MLGMSPSLRCAINGYRKGGRIPLSGSIPRWHLVMPHDGVMRRNERYVDALREVEDLVHARQWDGLLALREAARAYTHDPGVPMSITAVCDYHLARCATEWRVAAVLADHDDDVALGPLAEVAAQHHTWAELASQLAPGVIRVDFAKERVVRGEPIAEPPHVADGDLGLPFALQLWEPHYPMADYRADGASFPRPNQPLWGPVIRLPAAGEAIGDPHVVDAFKDLARPWLAGANGTFGVVTAEGDHLSALACLDMSHARVAGISFGDALAWLAWAGASGGSGGQRRGYAYGRDLAWWTVATLAGVSEDWPIEPDELAEIGEGLHWYLWDHGRPTPGEALRLAVHDDIEELGLAVGIEDGAAPRGAA